MEGDSRRIRIGTVGTQRATFIAWISGVTLPGGVGVIVTTNGKLGMVVSSARFKRDIRPNLRRKWSTTINKAAGQTVAFRNQPPRFSAWRLSVWLEMPNTICSPLFEIASVVVCFDHVPCFIVKVNNGIV